MHHNPRFAGWGNQVQENFFGAPLLALSATPAPSLRMTSSQYQVRVSWDELEVLASVLNHCDEPSEIARDIYEASVSNHGRAFVVLTFDSATASHLYDQLLPFCARDRDANAHLALRFAWAAVQLQVQIGRVPVLLDQYPRDPAELVSQALTNLIARIVVASLPEELSTP